MTNQLKMMVGVAVFAALALAGTLGAFVFGATQPVEAQGTPSATRSFNPATVAPGGDVVVTINASDYGRVGAVTETLPSGFTYTHTTLDDPADTVSVTGQNVRFTLFGDSSFTYTVRASMTEGDHTFSGTLRDDQQTDHDVMGADTVTVAVGGGTTMPMAGKVSNAMVTVTPLDPGVAAQHRITFTTGEGLDDTDNIKLVVNDDVGVPASISANTVTISGKDDSDSVSASPQSIVVEGNTADETHEITLYVGDMSEADGLQGLDAGTVTVLIRQSAGITNRTKAGDIEWTISTSEETTQSDAATAVVPRIIKLSSYKDGRNATITATAYGFDNTTTHFWRDADSDGSMAGDGDTLCNDPSPSGNIATCDFTLDPTRFDPGETGNVINARDGEGKTVSNFPSAIELEPSLETSPSSGNPGDTISLKLQDFFRSGTFTVDRILLGRTLPVCDGDAATSAPVCDSVNTREDPPSISFRIPDNAPPGKQELTVHFTKAGASDDEATNFTVLSGNLSLASTTVLPNQRVSVSGVGFTSASSTSDLAYIGMWGRTTTGCDAGDYGSVTIGGNQVAWDRINGGDPIQVTSGGTWSAPIDLPIDSSTTAPGTRELKIRDCKGGLGTIDITFPAREVIMTPTEGRVGTEVVITGRNFPVANDEGTRGFEVEATYDPEGNAKPDNDDAETDASGSFTIILKVPGDATIPSNNKVTVTFNQDSDGDATANTSEGTGGTIDVIEFHRIPQGTVSFSTARGAEGSMLTITAEGFARYTRVDEVTFAGNEITPSPAPQTNTNGNSEFQVRIPGSDPGIYIIRVEIDDVVASQTFTVVSGSGVVDGSVETILANVMSEDALDRVFKFDNETKEWQWHINDPAFASTNNLAGLSSGDLVWIKVSKTVTADVLGASVTLSCINEGMENEDCWNQISIP